MANSVDPDVMSLYEQSNLVLQLFAKVHVSVCSIERDIVTGWFPSYKTSIFSMRNGNFSE